MFHAPRLGARTWRGAALALAALAAVAVLQATAPADAHAIEALERRSKTTVTDYAPVKTVAAYCDEDQHVIGGGGEIHDRSEDIARFTTLQPIGRRDGDAGTLLDYFVVRAETVYHGQYVPWSVSAYVICADRDAVGDDWRIVYREFRNDSSADFVKGTAPCPQGTVAYSAGGSILDYVHTFSGRIGLQMIRTSGPLDIGRATARENTPLTTPNPWWLTVSAVCAKPQGGVHVEGLGDTDGDQKVTSFCHDPTTYVHGAGGGASGPGITDAGPSWLKAVVPSHALRSMTVQMAGSAPPSGGVVASHTCAVGH